ncbi:MAG: ATP-binding cassette domain-containing protein [Candidatus Delongbacteria bacterium]
MGELVVKLEHVKKSFGTNHVLRGLSLELHKGENLVVLGRSGSGKSVLIKCLVGLVELDEGRVHILGQDVAGLPRAELLLLRRRIGFLFQSSALYDSMTVRENLEFPLRRQPGKRTAAELEALVVEALQNVGLEAAMERLPAELSGGMRKRLGLARTLILKPEIMLYDEPTTGLDAITSKEISKLILDVQRIYRTSSIIITHDIDCARRTANRIIVLQDGRCTAQGSFEELANAADPWTRSFFE